MRSVIILGASADRSKFGNKALRAFRQHGYAVYPVNPRQSAIEGVPAWGAIGDVPVRAEVVSSYLRPEVLLSLLPEIAKKGCDEFWLNPGAESEEVVAEARRLGLNVIQGCSVLGLLGVSPESF